MTQIPHAPIPHCQFIDPTTPYGHKPGVLLVTSEPPLGQTFDAPKLRVCVDCLDSVCEGLKDDGYHTIRITAPESKEYHAHRR